MRVKVELEYTDVMEIQGILIGAAYQSEERARQYEGDGRQFSRFVRKRAQRTLGALNAFRLASGQDAITVARLMDEEV
jgi:hypothetical protein